MPYLTKRIKFDNFVFDIPEDVYEPAEDSFLFAENLDIAEGAYVLDIGAGCGLLGILATKEANFVVAVDLNPHAIRCGNKNSVRNKVSKKISFIQSSLFNALRTEYIFDLIMFNAPYLPSKENKDDSWINCSWDGGTNGRQVIDSFISDVALYLKPNGKVLLMQSTLTGLEDTIKKFGKHGLKAYVKASKKLPFFETLTLIEAKPIH